MMDERKRCLIGLLGILATREVRREGANKHRGVVRPGGGGGLCTKIKTERKRTKGNGLWGGGEREGKNQELPNSTIFITRYT